MISLLTILFFMLGAYSIAAQVYFIRELLVVFFGNELCLGIVFSAWFFGIGLGAAAGGVSVRSRRGNCLHLFVTTQAVLVLLPFLLVPEMRLLRAVFQLPPGAVASLGQVVTGTFLSIFPFSLVAGFSFPAACRAVFDGGFRGSLRASP